MSTATASIDVRLNGEAFRLPAGSTISDLLARLGLPEDRVAVELGGRIVRRPDWPATRLEAGAAVEVVQLVGGG